MSGILQFFLNYELLLLFCQRYSSSWYPWKEYRICSYSKLKIDYQLRYIPPTHPTQTKSQKAQNSKEFIWKIFPMPAQGECPWILTGWKSSWLLFLKPNPVLRSYHTDLRIKQNKSTCILGSNRRNVRCSIIKKD